MPLTISAVYGSFLALFLIMLAFPVMKLRRGLKVGLGDGGHRSLQQAIRAHGNAAEFVPVFVILLAIYELNHASVLALHIFGSVFLFSRLAHAWGLYSSNGVSIGRVIGVVGSFGCIIGLAAANILKAVAL